ncbi:BTB/POZ and TAZ domain-containing protein 4 [Phtheirospermum japonicum]|uniref:BTB/POZ and TAZ domain-containing protein 4 n=1 Tax=Phtheirospermum japonicum TaxID=374723 RepID=A0A830C2A2_9LAMI|nr:BTB/POZ and TAZ domain-containing protein 4 [Phtheirospermum japonicum]
MDCVYEEFQSTLEKSVLPHPPPLPVHLNTKYNQKGFAINGQKIRGHCCVSNAVNSSMDRLFDEGYRADVSISTDGGAVIYAHASVLGVVSPVFKAMLKKLKGRGRNRLRSISIRGVPPEVVCIFIRFLYSSSELIMSNANAVSCYLASSLFIQIAKFGIYSCEEENMENYALPLLVLSHAYAVPQLKRISSFATVSSSRTSKPSRPRTDGET